jgi:hypothetical protein
MIHAHHTRITGSYESLILRVMRVEKFSYMLSLNVDLLSGE